MSQEEYQSEMADHQQEESTDAARIATEVGTKTYFLTEQARNLEEWAMNASQIFKFTGDIMTAEYEIKSSNTLDEYSGAYEERYSRSKKEFDAFCILNRKVQKKNDEIQNLANYFSQKNTKKNFFNGWKMYSDKKKYIRKMDQKAQKYHNERIMKNVLKSWLDMTMVNNKIKIKNDVLQKTEIEVSRIQTQYERLIRTLQETLEKKLTELKKEEQEHKMLHDKYEAMYSRARVQGSVRQ